MLGLRPMFGHALFATKSLYSCHVSDVDASSRRFARGCPEFASFLRIDERELETGDQQN